MTSMTIDISDHIYQQLQAHLKNSKDDLNRLVEAAIATQLEQRGDKDGTV